jgi:hypothetical protein
MACSRMTPDRRLAAGAPAGPAAAPAAVAAAAAAVVAAVVVVVVVVCAGSCGWARAGEAVEQVVVDPPGDDGLDGGVAAGAGAGRAALAVAGELVEGDGELEADGLAGPPGQAAGGEQPGTGFLEGVVLPLRLGAGVVGAAPGGQRPEDRAGGGAAGRQVTLEPARAVERRRQPHAPAGESVVRGVGGGVAAAQVPGDGVQVGQPAPRLTAARSAWSPSPRCWAGSRPVRRVSCRAHDSDTRPPARAAPMTGWARRVFIRATWAVAARRVARVCQVSHIRGDRCPPAARPPPGAENAASTRACAAACRASETASARRQSACTPAGQPAGSACARNSSPAARYASACAGSRACMPRDAMDSSTGA